VTDHRVREAWFTGLALAALMLGAAGFVVLCVFVATLNSPRPDGSPSPAGGVTLERNTP
jgi:hypothetical protein